MSLFAHKNAHMHAEEQQSVIKFHDSPPPQTASLIGKGIFTHITYTTEAVADVYEIKCCDVCTHADIFQQTTEGFAQRASACYLFAGLRRRLTFSFSSPNA